MKKKAFFIFIIIITTFTSCEIIKKRIIERTATAGYIIKKYGAHINRFFPLTCNKIMFNEFKSTYEKFISIQTRLSDTEKNEILSKIKDIKYESNKIFIFSIDSNKPQTISALAISFTLQDNKNTIIKNQSFSYSTRMATQGKYGSINVTYKFKFLLVLEEKLSKKNMEKDRWPMFLTIRFPDKKFIKYKLY